MNDILAVFNDLSNLELERQNLKVYNKIKCSLINGDRVYWYYKDEEEFCEEEGINPKDMSYWSGIITIIPDRIKANMDSDIEPDDCIVIIDWHPCEKCYPETAWVTLNRLLYNDDLIEIYKKENNA